MKLNNILLFLFISSALQAQIPTKTVWEPTEDGWVKVTTANENDITMQSYNNKPIMHRNTFLTIKGKEHFVYTPEPADADTNPDYERLKWGIKIAAPLYQQLVDWFREKHNIIIHEVYSATGWVWQVSDLWEKVLYFDKEKNKAIEEAFKLI